VYSYSTQYSTCSIVHNTARKFRSKEKHKKQGQRGYERSEVRVNGRIVKWEKERKNGYGRAIGVVHVGAIYVSMKVRWDLF
jgi:hypothetical protein